jgi:ankyrin repeat protein
VCQATREKIEGLHRAAQTGDVDGLPMEPSGDLSFALRCRDEQGGTLLVSAARSGQLAFMNALLRFPDVQVNAQDLAGLSALHYAIGLRRLDMVQALLARDDIDVNIQARAAHRRTPLLQAIEADCPEIGWELLRHPNINVNITGKTGGSALILAIREAIYHDHAEFFLALLSRPDLDLDARDEHGRTALMWAAWRGLHDVVRDLLARGADFELRDCWDRTALEQDLHLHPRIRELFEVGGLQPSSFGLWCSQALAGRVVHYHRTR